MAWPLSLIALPFVGGLCLLFWRQQRAAATRTTSQHVRCPLYEEEANVQVQTRQARGQRPYHTDITSCSLLCQGPMTLGSRTEWTSDMPYYAVHPLVQKEGPVYETEVHCQKTCLKTLNYAEEANSWQERAGVSGVVDSAELAQRVIARTRTTSSSLKAPWSYGV